MTTQLELFAENSKKLSNQHKLILGYLNSGGSLTVGEALEKLGIYALSQRCGAQGLRGMGYPIKDRWKELPNGKRVKEYYL